MDLPSCNNFNYPAILHNAGKQVAVLLVIHLLQHIMLCRICYSHCSEKSYGLMKSLTVWNYYNFYLTEDLIPSYIFNSKINLSSIIRVSDSWKSSDIRILIRYPNRKFPDIRRFFGFKFPDLTTLVHKTPSISYFRKNPNISSQA